MGQTADQLRQDIEHKRDDAAAKIDAIETQFEDTARRVQDTAKRVKENVDLRQQIQERPLVALGAALVGGFVLGGILGGEQKGGQPSQHAGEQHGGGARPRGVASGIKEAAKRSGLEDTVSSVTAAVMGMATDKIKSTVDQTFPGFGQKMQAAQQAGGGLGQRQEAALQVGSSGGQTDAPGRTATYHSPSGASSVGAHG